MLATYDAVRHVLNRDKINLELSKIDVWSRETDFDVCHFWGFSLDHSSNLLWAKKAGKKVVVTALFGSYESSYEKLRYLYSRLFYKVKVLSGLVPLIDSLIVVNEHQKEVAVKYFGFLEKTVAVIPNVIHDKVFAQNMSIPESKIPFDQYILCTGNICRRKNQ